jgi:hypothetical protein
MQGRIRARTGARGKRGSSLLGRSLAAAAVATLATLTGAGAFAGAFAGTGSGVAGGVARTANAAATTCSSAPTKCYLVDVAPTAAPAGSKTSFMFSLTDEAPEQKLGSIKITAPPAPGDFAITVAGVSGPAGSTVTATTTTVVFKTLDITPGTTKSVTIPARVPCGTGTYAWSTTARQSNQFNGPPGNYMLLTANSELTSTISGSCTIEFMNEPKGTLVGKSITTTFDNTPAGASIAVGVYSGMSGTPVLLPTFSGTISVSLLGGPAGATLSGNTVVMHSGGSAAFSFGTLSITAPGMGYQLEAESNVPGVQSAHSVPFAIYQTLTKCASSHCSGAAKGSTVTLSSAATLSGTRSGTAQGFLGLGFEQIPGFTAVTSCGGYKIGILSATTSFEVLKATGNAAPKTATTSWTVTVEISKSVVQTKKLRRPSPNDWQICYASTTPFMTATGAIARTSFTISTRTTATTYYYGRLPACSSTPVAPCVLSKSKDYAGDVVITFLASGDPAGRF